MHCPNCHADAELKIDHERDDYTGTVTCSKCGTVRKRYGDSAAEVVQELEKQNAH